QGLNKALQWDGDTMEFTNINDTETLQICIEDHFSILDGDPTFDRKMTDPFNAKQFSQEMIRHTYREGWKLPEMPM
ncbi:MAG: gfo/Idh/MocA family oxidoreductase, partial [Bacteroidales bacterium]